MNIRSATEKDLEECAELGRIPEFELPSGGHIGSDSLINYLDPDFFLIAKEDNQIIGYALGERMKGKVGMLWFLMIHKDFRNKGFGVLLLQEFEKRAKTRGVEWLVLYGPALNEATLKFYERHGYNKGKEYYEFNKQL